MEGLALVLIVVIVLFVVWRLGVLESLKELARVATRETSAFNREHKVKVIKRYSSMEVDIEMVKKVNENIALIDNINFE
jgi:hypothetical protein